MKVAVIFSGGKDSTYATYLAMKQGWNVKCLLTIFPKREDSWMFHYPCVELTKLQAKAMQLKHITKKTLGEKTKELEDLKEVLDRIKDEIDGVVSGVVESNYQKSRIDRICSELGLKSLAPIWHKDPEELLREEGESGFDIIITSVSADGFDESWLGRRIDKKCIEDLIILHEKYGIHITAEGGEYESLVLDGPIFTKKIEIIDTEKIWDKKTQSGFLRIKKAVLVEK